jgi:hypothetical protein
MGSTYAIKGRRLQLTPRASAAASAIAIAMCCIGLVPAAAAGAAASADRADGGSPSSAQPATSRAALGRVLSKMPLSFVRNDGQVDRRVLFSVHAGHSTAFFTRQGLTLSLAPATGGSSGWTVRQWFPGSTATTPVAAAPAPGTVSFFRGPKSGWTTAVPTFSGITYPSLWPGVDLRYSGAGGALEYTFVVSPRAQPSTIRIRYDGASVRLEPNGDLRVATGVGAFRDTAPVAFQVVDGHRVAVSARFVKMPDHLGGFGFRIGSYDRSSPLLIDPVMIGYAGYVGGDQYEDPYGVAVDGSGHAYLMGATHSAEDTFPVKVGPDLHYWGKSDAFVCKVAIDGSSLDYCGYIGGSRWDRGRAIAVDAAGNAYVVGHTKSHPGQGFPVTVGPDLTFNGNADAFVCKVVPDGTSLDYCGYIGGKQHDEGKAVAIDAAGNAYVTGGTHSTEADGFPVTVGPDLTQNGDGDVWVAKVSADGTHLVYCGYIGGSDDEHARGIGVDAAGNAYVGGSTASSESEGFPLLVGPDLTFNGNRDAFVTSVSADGTHLLYSGYIGGSGIEEVYGLRVKGGAAYIAGSTNSSDGSFPVKIGPSLVYGGGPRDAFLTKVDPGGAALTYSGFLGGSGHDDARGGLALDTTGRAFVTGATGSTDFPVVGGPDPTYNGGSTDAFATEVSVDGSTLIFSGFIGGSKFEQGRGIAMDPGTGIVYVGGATSSGAGSFPVKVGPDLTYNGGKTDGFIVSLVPS